MTRTTTTPATQLPTGYDIREYKAGGFAAVYAASGKWVCNARRQALNRASENAAIAALVKHLDEQADMGHTAECGHPVPANFDDGLALCPTCDAQDGAEELADAQADTADALTADEATARYTVVVAVAEATGEAQPLVPGDTGLMVQPDGSVKISMDWIEAHAEPDECPVVPTLTPVPAATDTDEDQADEADEDQPAQPGKRTAGDQALLAKLADGTPRTRNDLTRSERRLARKLTRAGLLVQVRMVDGRVAWTTAPTTPAAE